MTGSLALEDVTVQYGSERALDAASVRFDAGESTALVGANGSGKTTMLRLLAGLAAPTKGQIVGGVAAVAFVRQLPRQHGWMPLRVHDVIQMGRYRDRGLLGRMGTRDRSLIDEVAHRMDVAPLLSRQLGELSGGQRQRVLVAQALVQEAELLLLDEPVTGLDIPSREIILDVVAGEAKAGRIVVFSTHDLDEAARASQVVLLAGRVIASGCPSEVLTPALLGEVFGSVRVLDGHESMIVDDHGHGSHQS